MRRFIVVTGTDTAVGKTVVTACLAAAWRQGGASVRALKPVASGTPVGDPSADAVDIGIAAGHAPLCFASFAEALSPHLAAERAGAAIRPAALLAWIHEHAGECTFVEGSGGWEVPLAEAFRVSDLAVALQADVVVVARNRLGVLNHAILTVAAVRARGLRVIGVALSPAEAEDAATASNLAELRRFIPGVAVVPVARVEPRSLASAVHAGERLRAAFAGS